MNELYTQCLAKQESKIYYKFSDIPVLYTKISGFCDDITSIIIPDYFEKVMHTDFLFTSMLYTCSGFDLAYRKNELIPAINAITKEMVNPALIIPPKLDIDIINLRILKNTVANARKDLCYLVEGPEKLGFYHVSSDGVSILIHQPYCFKIEINE
ncbi:MAG: hypothetical protein PHF86_09775 [Candidatus Nanoarchaeia archaeon]|nr:hypothetical protein [Candidatus Nanoarchaeia archaeon]